MMVKSRLKREDLEFFIALSIAYVVAYTMTMGFIAPIQSFFLSNVSAQIGLLFLPHGVRIISMYYYGWRSAVFLLPPSYLMWFFAVYVQGTPLHTIAPILSLVSCYLGVVIAKFGIRSLDRANRLRHWKIIIVAGAIGSILNGISLSLVHSSDAVFLSTIGYTIGDIAGLILCLFANMYFFKALREYKNRQ